MPLKIKEYKYWHYKNYERGEEMQRHFDELGRIVIPKDMREKLDFGKNDFAEIKLNNN